MKLFISTQPFGEENDLSIKLLSKLDLDIKYNTFKRKCKEHEFINLIRDCDFLIAGTDKISSKIIDLSPKLKLIARVGIGLDGIDLKHAKKKGIKVTFTPDAPAQAVAELTLANIFNLLRKIHISNLELRQQSWSRYYGINLEDATIGIIGAGRIGSIVINKLFALGVKLIKVNDLNKNFKLEKKFKNKLKWVSKEEIYKSCKIISLHVPLYKKTHNLISIKQMNKMSSDTMLINTSRGGIINEKDLYFALKNKLIQSAAIDVFEKEPYKGLLTKLDNCLLTAHLGSMTKRCRSNMEIEATKEVIRFVNKKPLKTEVPDFEYKRS